MTNVTASASVIVTFGIHAGKSLSAIYAINPSYVSWLSKKAFSEALRTDAKQYLEAAKLAEKEAKTALLEESERKQKELMLSAIEELLRVVMYEAKPGSYIVDNYYHTVIRIDSYNSKVIPFGDHAYIEYSFTQMEFSAKFGWVESFSSEARLTQNLKENRFKDKTFSKTLPRYIKLASDTFSPTSAYDTFVGSKGIVYDSREDIAVARYEEYKNVTNGGFGVVLNESKAYEFLGVKYSVWPLEEPLY